MPVGLYYSAIQHELFQRFSEVMKVVMKVQDNYLITAHLRQCITPVKQKKAANGPVELELPYREHSRELSSRCCF